MRVGSYRFLLDIADPPMAETWHEEIGCKEKIEEHTLAQQYDQAKERAWLCTLSIIKHLFISSQLLTFDLQERQQMHSLVLGLFKQRC
jgi:hypothetical protein